MVSQHEWISGGTKSGLARASPDPDRQEPENIVVPNGRIASQAIAVRYSATFVGNVLRISSSFASGIVVARALGASSYGQLTFILASFTAISSLMDSGSASAFSTLLFARRGRAQLFGIYGVWLLIQFVILSLGILIVLPSSTVRTIWFSTDRVTILLGWCSAFANSQLWTAVSQMGEALRETVRMQIAATARGLAHIALLLIAVWLGFLSIRLVFALQAVEYGAIAIAFVGPLYRDNLQQARATNRLDGSLFSAFMKYCRPLIVHGWVVFVAAFADRWLLERFGGSIQQGYFAIAQQFSVVSMLATTALLQVLWKELAEAHDRGAAESIKQLYVRATRMLFLVGAWTSFLVMPYSQLVIKFTLGPAFAGALVPFALMLLYPIQQSLGQIQATFFQATGRTSTYMKVGLASAAINVPLTYFAFAPRSLFGLGGGAIALALKLLVAQFIGVTLQAIAIRRAVGWSQDPFLQTTVLAVCAMFAYGAKWALLPAFEHLPFAVPAVCSALLCGSVYTIATAAVVWRWPVVAGLDADSIRVSLRVLRKLLADSEPLRGEA